MGGCAAAPWPVLGCPAPAPRAQRDWPCSVSPHSVTSPLLPGQQNGLRNAPSYPTPSIAAVILEVTVKQHPHYGDISRIAATGLPPALCFSGRGQQQENKIWFYVASELCWLNEPTNPAVPARVLLALLSTRSIELLTGCCL